jgi:hypothetical protein
MEKTNIHPHPIGVAAGLTAGVIYVFCVVALVMWPTQSLRFLANWFHGIDLTQIYAPVQLAFNGFLIGLFSVVLFFYFVGLIYGLIYNLCYAHCKKRRWI